MTPTSLSAQLNVASNLFDLSKSILLKALPLIALIAGLSAGKSLAQSTPGQDLVNKMMPKPVPTSPNVASLGKYGDYQVAYFSGLPDISIPIFEVQSGSLKVPITLSYHASGNKQTDVASWVGLGWSLSTGGQISRNISGKPDEFYYSANTILSDVNICDGTVHPGTFYYLLSSANGVIDTDPDVFSYSFPGKNGKFIWPYGGPLLIPYAPLKVTSSSAFDKFEITDENGVLYKFGNNAKENTTATNGGNPAFNATTAWHMTDMMAPNSNDAVSFTYQDVGTFSTHDISYSYTLFQNCTVSGTYNENGGAPPCPTNTWVPQKHNNDSFGNQMGPSEIISEAGKVKFFLGGSGRGDFSNLKYLDSIEVRGLDNQLLKTIKFVYSYFKDVNNINAALKLDAVLFKDNVGNIVQQYGFQYFTNSFSWALNSDNYLNARDLWGYYNGALANTDLLIPKTVPFSENGTSTINLTFGGATNRAVNTLYVKEGMLKTITFPTGGFTEFDYESNRYMADETPTLAGGLRVAKITSSADSSSLPVVKSYRYGVAESGCGVANFREYQFNYSNSQKFYGGICIAAGPSLIYDINSFHSNTAFNTDMFDSSPVIYPSVTEYFGNASGKNNGSIVYEYDSLSPTGNVDLVVPNSGMYYRNSFGWKRGKLTNKSVFDSVGNKLSESIIHYVELNAAENYIGLGVHTFILGSTDCTHSTCRNEAQEYVSTQHFFFRPYFQNSGAMLESTIKEYNYENGNVTRYVMSSTENTYDAQTLQLTSSTKSRGANNEKSVTVHRYSSQFITVPNSTGAAKGIKILNTKNIISIPLETYTYISDGVNNKVVSAQITTYRENENNTSYVVPDRIYFWESDQPVLLSAYVPSVVNNVNSGIDMDSKFTPRINLVNYDHEGNLLTASKINSGNVSYLYHYNKTLPVAEVANASSSEFFYEGFEESAGAGVTTNSSIAHSGNKYQSGNYSLNFTAPNTRLYIVEYWYRDIDNLWKHISKRFTSSPMILGEGTAIDNVRVYPADAQMKTYTYDPSLGMTSSLSESGLLYRYDYDTFGRLWRIRNEKGNIEKQYDYHYKGN
jgi:YD repeat-containing protein